MAGKAEDVLGVGDFVTSVLTKGVVGAAGFGDAIVIGDGAEAVVLKAALKPLPVSWIQPKE